MSDFIAYVILQNNKDIANNAIIKSIIILKKLNLINVKFVLQKVYYLVHIKNSLQNIISIFFVWLLIIYGKFKKEN